MNAKQLAKEDGYSLYSSAKAAKADGYKKYAALVSYANKPAKYFDISEL